MPDGVKFSEFPGVSPDNADYVVGLHSGANARFSVANIVAAVRSGLSNLFVPKNDVGAAGGVAELDANGKVPSAQLPPIASTAADVTYDNTQSGLTADDVQEAIDELAAGGVGGGADEATIAPVETTTTATVAHPLGSIFYLNGNLYRALSDIAIGGTINVGTNAVQTTVAANFRRIVTLTQSTYNSLTAAEKAADIVYIITNDPVDYAKESEIAYVESGTTASKAYAIGDFFCMGGTLYRAKTAIASGATFTVDTNCEAVTATDGCYFPCEYSVVSSRLSDVSGSVQRIGNHIMVALKGTAAEALTSSSEIVRVPAGAVASSGFVIEIYSGYNFVGGRVNAGTGSLSGVSRIFPNGNIASGANVTITGIFPI